MYENSLGSDLEKELIPVTDEYGNLTGQIVDRNIAHQQGIPHLCVHIRLVNTNKFKDDIGIYLSVKAIGKGGNMREYFQRTAGGHVSLKSTRDRDHINQREKLSVKNALSELAEELKITLLRKRKININSNSIIERYSQRLTNLLFLQNTQNGNSSILDGNRKFYSLFRNIKYGNKRNQEHVDIYVLEYNGDITDFDKSEIAGVTLFPSRKVLEMLEDSGKFGGENEENWKGSIKYLLIKSIIYKLQQIYNIT